MAAAACSEPQARSISAVQLQNGWDAGRAPALIDVRSAEEYAAGHIPGAIHIPYQHVAERIDEVDAPNRVAPYCQVGPRARKGEAALRARGYAQPIYQLEGGLRAWRAGGYPVEAGP